MTGTMTNVILDLSELNDALDGSDEEFTERNKYMQWYRELFHERTRHADAEDWDTVIVFERNLDYLQTKISRGPGPIWKKFFEELISESSRSRAACSDSASMTL